MMPRNASEVTPERVRLLGLDALVHLERVLVSGTFIHGLRESHEAALAILRHELGRRAVAATADLVPTEEQLRGDQEEHHRRLLDGLFWKMREARADASARVRALGYEVEERGATLAFLRGGRSIGQVVFTETGNILRMEFWDEVRAAAEVLTALAERDR